MQKRVQIGTSGFSYSHWKNRFYPANLKSTEWLEYYCQHFSTVELNNTFYHLPSESALQRWYETTPDDFKFTVKASRYITHIKKLKDCSEPIDLFLERISILKNKLGPILFQLPPNLNKNLMKLESFFKLIPDAINTVFEFRNSSWHDEDTFELMRKYNISFCIHDILECPKVITGDLIYMRFHGVRAEFNGCYSEKDLLEWGEWAKANLKKAKTFYAYFNNDQNAYAIKNASMLSEIMEPV